MSEELFFKFMVAVFVVSLGYILYFLIEKILRGYFDVKKTSANKKEIIKEKKSKAKKINIKDIDQNYKKSNTESKKLNDNELQELSKILKKLKVHVSKGYFDTAKNLIVEGLAIDKYNTDLNIELAFIYEKEKKYSNAEYIYRELTDNLENSFEVKKKLGFILALQKKYKESIKIYESIHQNHASDDEIIDMLGELCFSVKDYKKSLKYLNLYLKEYPRSIEKLFLKAETQKKLDKKSEALLTYKKILELQPYNTDARDFYKKIEANLEK